MTVIEAQVPDRTAPAPATARVWPTLARIEARRIVTHPMVMVAIVVSALLLLSMNREYLPELRRFSTYTGLGLAPLTGAALLVGHLAASRPRRNDTVELEEPTPASPAQRTLGTLVGGMVVVPVAVALVIGYVAYLYLTGGTGAPWLGELLIGPVSAGVGMFVGVAVGTWFPNRFSGVVGLGLMAALQIGFHDAPGTRHWMALWHTRLDFIGADLWIRPTWPHLTYVVGLGVVIGAVAMVRHRTARVPALAVAGLGLLIGVTGVVGQSRVPAAAQTEAVIEILARPDKSWIAVTRPDATYLVQPGYERWVDWWDDITRMVLEPIGGNHRPDLVFEQRRHPALGQIIEEHGSDTDEGRRLQQVLNELFVAPDPDLEAPGGATSIEVAIDQVRSEEGVPIAVAVAQRAVGLPVDLVTLEGPLYTQAQIDAYNTPIEDPTQFMMWPGRELGEPPPQLGDRMPLVFDCDPEGQAREIVAAWLLGRAFPSVADRYRQIRTNGPDQDEGELISSYALDTTTKELVDWSAWSWVPLSRYGGGVAFLASPTALDLAAQLLDLPQAEVAAHVNANWDQWTDPATGVDALIEAFGLEPPPTPEQLLERSGLDPARFGESVAAYPHDPERIELLDQPYPVCQ